MLNTFYSASLYFILNVSIILSIISCERFSSNFPNSPNKKYEAVYISTETGKHYKVIDSISKQVYFITYAEFSTSNDAKAGYFSDDSTQFATAYHYGHKGNYTWIGIWDIKTGKFLRYTKTNGWTRNISWVFDK